MSSNMMYVVE
jgi:hypothetical protein